ncbi:hypothetical protein [Streptomyces sp. SID3212]|uniref:hypothetical protein n=1 Tax=Streptomyces sp. SID3212 TaxID=2690259 RepID=UPI001370B5C2|nr:hypothetical protein [Streptomyces sp. SID3212]MYV58043.1 hypothetical protein [Streptomyces sp. SID3212]
MARNTTSINVRVLPGSEIKKISDQLREIDRTLPAKFRKDLKAAAKPLVVQAKAAAKEIPITRPDRRRLRKKIATGIALQVSTGKRARIRVVTRMPDSKTAIIPRGLGSPAGFRHPVFGDANQWVVQHAANPANNWFMNSMQNGHADAEARIKETLREARRDIVRAGRRH